MFVSLVLLNEEGDLRVTSYSYYSTGAAGIIPLRVVLLPFDSFSDAFYCRLWKQLCRGVALSTAAALHSTYSSILFINIEL